MNAKTYKNIQIEQRKKIDKIMMDMDDDDDDDDDDDNYDDQIFTLIVMSTPGLLI